MTGPQFLAARYGKDGPAPEQSNLARLALTTHVHNSHHFFASNFCVVGDKRGKLTLLKPFVGQAILRYSLDSQLRNQLPGRICEVKARAVGWTIENISRVLHFCLDENHMGLILVDDEEVAAAQATRLNTMLNGLPTWLQPMRRIQNLKHLVFDNPNPKERKKNPGLNSEAKITVPSAFRGINGPIIAIMSEYAHMLPDRQQQIQQGLMSIIPLTPEGIAIFDTTPNGEDESYAPMVREAVKENPKWTKRIEDWRGELDPQDVLNGILGEPDVVIRGYPGKLIPAISPWRLHPEYSAKCATTPLGILRPMTRSQKAETLNSLGKISLYGGEEELEMRDRYGVCLERLWWRRRTIDQYQLPTEEMRLLTFRQEYLGGSIESAFIDSGTAPFDRGSLDVLGRMERTPFAVGLFRSEGEFEHWEMNGEGITNVHRDPNPWEEIRLYAPPENGEQYTMGIDTDLAYESPDSDATVAQVVRSRDNKIVCTYEARVPSYLLIKQLKCIYRWYNNCYYAVELVGMGYDLQRACMSAGMTNVHYWKRYDADNPEPSRYPGWETNHLTRPLMDQLLLELLCHRNPANGKPDPLLNIPDATTIKEIRGLSRGPTGSFKSARGHDDHCVSGDSWITIREGVRRADEIEIGDEVLTHEGRFRKVLAISKREATPCDLSVSGALNTKITANHPLWVSPFRVNRLSRRVAKAKCWMPLEDIASKRKSGERQGYYVRAVWPKETVDVEALDLLPYCTGSYHADLLNRLVATTYGGMRLQPNQNVISRYLNLDADLCFILGYFGAEGCAVANGIAFASHADELSLQSFVMDYFSALGLKPTLSKTSTNGAHVRVPSMPLRGFFAQFGTRFDKAYPSWCGTLPTPKQKLILFGHLAGDGCFTGTNVKVGTISPQMAFQLLGMARRCGYRPTMRIASKRGRWGIYNAKDQYIISFNGEDSRAIVNELPIQVWWSKNIKYGKVLGHSRTRTSRDEESVLHPIQTWRQRETSEPVYNFMVEEDHSYCVNGLTVHNCDAFLIAACIARDPYSGIVRKQQETEDQKREEFERTFRWLANRGGSGTSRNHPTLAEL